MPYHDHLSPPWLRRLARALLPAAYVCLLLAGVASFIAPPGSVTEATSNPVTITWSSFMVVGAVLGALGAITRRPGVEWVGTFPLLGSWLAYGIVLLHRQWSIPGLASNGTVVAWGLIALGTFVTYRSAVLGSAAVQWQRGR